MLFSSSHIWAKLQAITLSRFFEYHPYFVLSCRNIYHLSNKLFGTYKWNSYLILSNIHSKHLLKEELHTTTLCQSAYKELSLKKGFDILDWTLSLHYTGAPCSLVTSECIPHGCIVCGIKQFQRKRDKIFAFTFSFSANYEVASKLSKNWQNILKGYGQRCLVTISLCGIHSNRGQIQFMQKQCRYWFHSTNGMTQHYWYWRKESFPAEFLSNQFAVINCISTKPLFIIIYRF